MNYEKDKELAELLGWTHLEKPDHGITMVLPYEGYPPVFQIGKKESVPEYSSDLNAVRAVVMDLNGSQRQAYRENLCRSLHIVLALDATAEERVDALIETLKNH